MKWSDIASICTPMSKSRQTFITAILIFLLKYRQKVFSCEKCKIFPHLSKRLIFVCYCMCVFPLFHLVSGKSLLWCFVLF